METNNSKTSVYVRVLGNMECNVCQQLKIYNSKHLLNHKKIVTNFNYSIVCKLIVNSEYNKNKI